jgi:hypothetical protein
LYALGPTYAGHVSSHFFGLWKLKIIGFVFAICGVSHVAHADLKLIKIYPEAGSLIWSEEEQNLRTSEAARTDNSEALSRYSWLQLQLLRRLVTIVAR